MNREQNKRVRELFESAWELPKAGRLSWLKDQASDDFEVYAEVARLLQASGDSGDFLAEPAYKREVSPIGAGSTIGCYRLLRTLGSGGMGIVYQAERADGAFDHLAAIKIIRPELRSDPLIRRFLKERDMLAKLDHPNIARILDGGDTETGLPYFAMDFVDGKQLDQFCAERGATLTQRLNLFRQICDVVQYLHAQKIIHRDLKPANLLVTHSGLVKLLDFGIARRSEVKPGDTTGLPMATPEYASPEQILSGTVTPLGDVYSLGVILYEMLTGVRPLKLEGMSLNEMTKAVADTEPQPPSAVAVPESVAQTRKYPDATLSEIHSKLAGDLDAIVMMALRKEPQRRYASPSEFAADVFRYQQNLPVVARGNSPFYRAGKTLQRHGLRIAASLIVAASLAFGGTATYKAIHYRNQIEAIRTEVETLRDRYAPVQAMSNTPAPTGQDAAPTNARLSTDLDQLAHHFEATTPNVLRSPLAPRGKTGELVQQSLDFFSQAAPVAIKNPESAAALGRAYLAVSQAQWNPDGASLNQPARAASSCEKALQTLKSAAPLENSGEVRQVAKDLLEALQKIPVSH